MKEVEYLVIPEDVFQLSRVAGSVSVTQQSLVTKNGSYRYRSCNPTALIQDLNYTNALLVEGTKYSSPHAIHPIVGNRQPLRTVETDLIKWTEDLLEKVRMFGAQLYNTCRHFPVLAQPLFAEYSLPINRIPYPRLIQFWAKKQRKYHLPGSDRLPSRSLIVCYLE